MAKSRRMGNAQSPTFDALIDATEQVIRDEGYAAATSRKIATVAGVKQQLLYYYFRTMDDLLLATFQRRTSRALQQLEALVHARFPIEAIWQNLLNRVDAKLVFEFMALSNRHSGIRAEISRFVVQSRRIEADAISRQLERQGIATGLLTPASISLIMFAISLVLRREEATGIAEGHAEVMAIVESLLGRARPD